MKYYIKMAFMPFIYLVFATMLGWGITIIDKNLIVLQYVLCAVNTLFYAGIVGMAAFKDGQKAVQIRAQNDIYRRKIVETGEDLPLDIYGEYTPWKGFFIAFLACVPSILLVIIHFIIHLIDPTAPSSVGMAAGMLSMVVFSYFLITETVTVAQYAFILLLVPFVCGVYGGMFVIGANKEQKYYDKIYEKSKRINGDKS